MRQPIPEISFFFADGLQYRLKVFRETAEWTMGDLLDIKGRPSIFINATFYDRESRVGDRLRWENVSATIFVADELGIHEITAEELDGITDDIRVISKFQDTA